MGFVIKNVCAPVAGSIDLTIELEDGSTMEINDFRINSAVARNSGRMTRADFTCSGVLTKVNVAKPEPKIEMVGIGYKRGPLEP